MDLPAGTVRRRVPLGRLAGTTVIDLGVSAGGDVALTIEEVIRDVLVWAPAATGTPRVVARGDGFGEVRTAGGLIALELPVSLIEGRRVVVLDPAGETPREVFRGPPAAFVRSLEFDGTHVAWSTDACQLVAPAVPEASTTRVPAGHCVRTEASFIPYITDPRSGLRRSLAVRARCLTAPGSRCRIELRAALSGRALGRLTARVQVGSVRILRIPRSRRAAARLRRDPAAPVSIHATVRDPDGRAHTVLVR